jgi:hypothetical protein
MAIERFKGFSAHASYVKNEKGAAPLRFFKNRDR